MILRNQKSVLVTIIILLVVTLALIGGGLFYKPDYKEEDKPIEPSKEVKKLTFEVDDETYAYECQSESCDVASETINDSEYGINYYAIESEEDERIINDKFVFIKDSKEVILYNFVNGTTLATYKAFKGYNASIEDDIYIVQDREGKWGVIQVLDDTIEQLIPFEYDFIGVPYGMFDGVNLSSDFFLTFNESNFSIVSKGNYEIYQSSEEAIVDFNENYIVTLGTSYTLVDYNNSKLLEENYGFLAIIGNYIGMLDDSFYIYDLATGTSKSSYYYVDSIDEIVYSLNSDGSILLKRENESESIV